MVVEGSTDKEVFETYVEHFLGLTLEGGQTVVCWTTSPPTKALGYAS